MFPHGPVPNGGLAKKLICKQVFFVKLFYSESGLSYVVLERVFSFYFLTFYFS